MNDTINQNTEALENARRMLAFIAKPVWGQTAEQTDAQHVSDYQDTLKMTRDTFPDMPETTAMNCILIEGTQLVMAYVGNSPTSEDRARAMVGFLQGMPAVLDNMVEMIEAGDRLRERVIELLEHNNKQLFENRSQRQQIRQLQAQVDHLLKTIPTPVEEL